MRFTCPRCRERVELPADAPSRPCPACGHAALTPSPDATARHDPEATTPYAPPAAPGGGAEPETVGGYRLLRPVGQGGMGVVYEAEQPGTGRRVAVKVIRPEFATSAAAVERFRREGRLAGTVTHPRCVFVVTADEEAGRPYLVMELMPGATLKDLVEERGPLAPAAAVSRVLDVIDGLRALHRRGIVHRDVKPSNCFLEEGGRVKVGDFGLARSLLADGDLTQTGQFLGTPLFASPEQLKGEAVDVRTDVYSVCATLYFLLTGRAPFQGGDAAAVAAHVASEPAPPLRSLRPGLPAALDRAVLRGLERDPRRRWRDLDQLRAALLPFGPDRPSVGDVWVRAAAYLIDYAVVVGLWLALWGLLRVRWPQLPPGPNATPSICSNSVEFDPGPTLVSTIPDLLYFGLLEGLWGCGLGKRLLGLRVARAGGTRPPGVPRALLRAAAFCLLMYLPRHLVGLGRLDCLAGMLLSALAWWNLGGLLLVALPMRRRNGYRGLHEFVSGTAVVRASWAERDGPERHLRRAVPGRAPETDGGDAYPATVGPFTVRRPLGWRDGGGVLLGEDVAVGRRVLLWVRPAGAPPLTPARCDLNRLTRLRWLAGGVEEVTRWDAFVAEDGRPLPDLVAAGPFSWEAARELLRQLTDELAAACADGTLPRTLSADQVWVRPDGYVLLLDMRPPDPADPAPGKAVPDERQILALLGRVAVLALEGRARPADQPPAPVRAPLPLHASPLLARLVGVGEPYDRVEDFRRALGEAEDRPARVGRSRRTFHLLAQAGLAFVALPFAFLAVLKLLDQAVWLLFGRPGRPGGDEHVFKSNDQAVWLLFLTVPMLASVAWAGLMRGGPSFWLCRLALVRSDGRRAARWQAALRSFLVWAQAEAILVGTGAAWVYLANRLFADRQVAGLVLSFSPACLVAYAALTAWLPRRTPHDRLAGTYLVPK